MIGTDEPVEMVDGGGGREFDELVHAFHRMSARIRERDEERVRLIADLNRRVEEATRDVLRADRLATLGGIAAGFAHELGNSIHVVRGYTSVALRELPKDHPNRRDIEAIRTESQRAAAMLERFLVFARARSVRMERQPVGPILAEVVDMLRPAADAAKVAIEVELDPALPDICVDLELVRQAAMNLCINALHACEGREHGKVCVRARPAAGGGVIVEVEDNGPGVPTELKAKVFEPFFTTKATGTGLGLSLVGHVVSAHRGSVEIDSSASGGARFRLRLPDGGAS
jgi:signal transduction histidine kinase